ncbi:hypothetical protein CFPU101_08330 [Chroococcus sp. FPU101]|nr:hypothetical protein CFPU101_08330 [Chroococcus sp. FPU101]
MIEDTMPNKRRTRQQTQQFFCPICQQRLWRSGGTKYHLYYQGKAEIQEKLNITSKRASFIATHHPVYVDANVWLEEFFCKVDLKMWLRLSKASDGLLHSRLATQADWERSVKTPDPDLPNSTVSEFTYRMSRRTGQHLARYEM